jgi:riboflavin kinase / FMN adenylyltransferase
MQLQRGFKNPAAYRGGYLSIGNFDGVHRGHQRIVSALVERARRDGVPAVVLTFDPHPIHLLRPLHAPPSLSTLAGKAELLAGCGVDCLIAYPTDEALLDLTPERFFAGIVQGEIAARGLVEGPNFFFGRDRAGDIETLRSLCDAAGLSLDVVPPVPFGDRLVSSSAVRSDIAAGRIAHAADLLGHPYRIRGTVIGGAARGGTLGFPTANLEQIETLLPADGVYAGIARCEGGSFPAAINVGHNPTFGEERRKVEVHLVDFTGDLYGAQLDVDLLDRLREIVRFDSAAELQQQLARDVEQAREAAQRHGGA